MSPTAPRPAAPAPSPDDELGPAAYDRIVRPGGDVAAAKSSDTGTNSESDARGEPGSGPGPTAVAEGARASRSGARRRRREALRAEEAKLRGRRRIAMAVAAVPFLCALISLVAVMTGPHGEEDPVAAAEAGAAAITVEPYLPLTSPAPTSPTPAVADPRTPPPIAPSSDGSHGGATVADGVGGLRATPSPTAAPADGGASDVASTASAARAVEAPTAAPTAGYCVEGGRRCPRRRVARCCSDVCARDPLSGEKTCTPTTPGEDATPRPLPSSAEGKHAPVHSSSDGTASPVHSSSDEKASPVHSSSDGKASPVHSSPDGGELDLATPGVPGEAPARRAPSPAPAVSCVGGGAPCPKRRFALCCSDVCVRDEVSGDKLCAPVPEKDATSKMASVRRQSFGGGT